MMNKKFDLFFFLQLEKVYSPYKIILLTKNTDLGSFSTNPISAFLRSQVCTLVVPILYASSLI